MGLCDRPQMVKQAQTISIVHSYCKQYSVEGKAQFNAMPFIPVCDPLVISVLQPIPGDTQKDKAKRYAKRRAEVQVLTRGQPRNGE